MERYDLVIVGGGPGGYPAAIRAAEAGLGVALLEPRGLGVECTLYGCVPSKTAAFYAASLVAARRVSEEFRADPLRVFEEARRVAGELSNGIEGLLSRLGVAVYREEAASLERSGSGGYTVRTAGGAALEASTVLLAPGTVPALPRWVERGPRVLDNRGLLDSPPEPGSSMLVVGGGAVGVEYAAVLAMLGYRVTLAEALERLLPGFPRGLSAYASRLLSRLGVEVLRRCPLERVAQRGDAVEAGLCGSTRRFDYAVIAVGRTPATQWLRGSGVALTEKGFIEVDERLETSLRGVFAAGDAAGPPLLAHKAIAQSIHAAGAAEARLRGREPAPWRPGPVPTVVHVGGVELGYVGVTLDEARARGLASVRIRLGWSLHARLAGAEDGYVAIVYEPDTGRIMGLEAAAPGAAELVAEAAVAIARGLGLGDLAGVIHPHPERSEALLEAVHAALGKPIHYLSAARRGARSSP